MSTLRTNITAGFLIAALLGSYNVFASHLIGDDFRYEFLDSSGGNYHYRVTLDLYVDCLAGQPEAIAQDNPAYFSVYSGTSFIRADSVHYTTSSIVPGMSTGPCGLGAVPLCVLKKTFVYEYHLPASASGYTITYQRCCKNAALTNIAGPGNVGSTYICTIPPIGTAHHNNSAVFTNYPPEIIGLGDPFIFDCSATDADGDSISYELCSPYDGATSSDIKPWPPLAPPYDNVTYTGGYTYSNPIHCTVPMSIDPVTGSLTCTPSTVGRYLVGVCCHEWRGGVMINTVRREFELAVQVLTTATYHPYAGHDTTIYVNDSVHFNATGASSYLWTPGTYLSSSTIPNPVGYFPDPGMFTYILHGTSDSGCTGDDTVIVNVLLECIVITPNSFTPNGDGRNDYLFPIPVMDAQIINYKIYNRKGELVYTGTPASPGWDGRYRGITQDIGTYFIEVFYQNKYGKLRTTRSSFTLIR